MNEVTLPPSPNWYLSSILSCAQDGTVAWGARNSIVIGSSQSDKKIIQYSLISNAHADRVTSVAFSPEFGEPDKSLIVSGGDEHIVRIWNVKTKSAVSSQEYMDTKQKVIGVDWSKCDPNLICFVSSEGILMAWTVSYNACQQYSLGKLSATCLSCSPHKSNIVAMGAKNGLIYIVNLQGNGTINYKLRGHDVEITSLSWCPTEINVLNDSRSNDNMLLASGAKDRSIFVWRAGGDGRSQLEISVPVKPLDTNQHRVKLGSSVGNWTAVCWAEPKLLLATSSWGELISWDFTMGAKSKPMCKLQHAKHARGLFCIANVPRKIRIEEENWRESSPLTVWTIAQDRQVIRSTINATECKIEYSVPTQGGYVYCMAACPLDTSRIAFGVGDAMLRLWNLSEPHESSFDVNTVWQKIMGKVRSLAWHPEKENLLAFGTGEGRVGVCDTNASKPPILYRQHHRHTVYSIGWGPNPQDKNFVLYSCGDGELVYYPSEKATKETKSVVKKDCTDFAWKPDNSCIAVGYENGSISFLNRDLQDVGHPIYSLKKAVQCLAWHPDSTATDLNLSPFRNYLAVAVNSSTITIFDLSDLMDHIGKPKEESGESSGTVGSTVSQHKVVASLCGHVEKVVSLAWSSHFSGHLVSGSYDYTAQVWKIESQELIATYTGHTAPVQSCMWSPLDPDYIITGSSDFTIRVWKVSDQQAVIPTEKPPTKRIRTKKNKAKKAAKALPCEIAKNVEGTDSPNESLPLEQPEVRASAESAKEPGKEIVSQKPKRDRPKKCSYLAAYSRRMNDKSQCLESLRNLAKSIRERTSLTNGTNGEAGDFEKSEMNGDSEKSEINDDSKKSEMNGDSKKSEVNDDSKKSEENDDSKKSPSLFGTTDELSTILRQEEVAHVSQGQYNVTTEMSLWNNSLRKNLQDATKEKRLNDFLVSLSTSLSMKTWQETCEAYATQLIFESNPTKAVSYLLCIHKIHRAVEVLLEQKMYREAYVLARYKLDAENPIFTRILEDWAANATREGNYEDVAHCYVKLGDCAKAASFIGRRKDLESLEVAAELALLSNEPGLSESLADQAFTEALLAANCAAARKLTEKFPQIQHREIQILVYEEMREAVAKVDVSAGILSWLQSKNDYGLLEILRERTSKYSAYYSRLTPNPNSGVPENEAMLWLVASHHIAMAVTAPLPEKHIRHVVTALSVISQYGIVYPDNNADKKTNSLLIRVLSILEAKSPKDETSLFAKRDNSVCTSLRAYLCLALLNWCVAGNHVESEELNVSLGIIREFLVDALDQQTVKYWSAAGVVNKLEAQLATALGKSQKGEDDEEEKAETTTLLEKLDRIKSEKKEFVDERVCAPSPILAYSRAIELANRLTDDSAKENFSKFVSETWTKAIDIANN